MPILLPYAFLLTFLLSTFALQWWQSSAYPLALWLIMSGTALCGIILSRFHKIFGYALLAATCGSMIATTSMMRVTRNIQYQTIAAHATGATLTLIGIVSAQPDDRQTSMQYRVKVERIERDDVTIDVQGTVLATDRAMRMEAQPGDRIRATGRLDIPGQSENFSYKDYLAAKGITAVFDSRWIEISEATNTHRIRRALWHLRRTFEHRINLILPEPAAALAAGLLTGAQSGLPEILTEDFRRTGLSHIVAISGSNITIIIGIIGGMLFFLPLRWRLIPSIIAIVLFALFVGAGASVIRASVTGILGIMALHAGRLAQTRLMILWTAFAMLVWNPLQLSQDMGFQLSFLAVLGLAELSPVLEPLVRRVPQTLGLREALQTTLAAQLTAMPWSAAQFGLLSLIAPVANLLTAPLVPIGMLFGFLGAIVGWADRIAGHVIAIPGLLALEGIVTIATTLSNMPGSAVMLPPVGQWGIAAYYAGLVIFILCMRRFTSDTGTPAPLLPAAARG